MKRILFSLQGNEDFGNKIAQGIDAEFGNFKLHRFPDGETYIRVLDDVKDKVAIVVCTLDRPDEKFLPLFFLCKLLKTLGAKAVWLVAPYLAYMRQDKMFHPGEAVSSEYFAALLSSFADRLFTIDPHLHRRHSMNEIYSIPCHILHAAPAISQWIKHNIPNALLIGPDSESEQWVSQVAKDAGAPFIVLEKIRLGDAEVKVSIPEVDRYKSHTPVLVDDIVSTAKTMIETVKHLRDAGMKPPICIGVHAVFAGNAYTELMQAGVESVITCNTIQHSSNQIDVSEMIIFELNAL
jgi:ribose-phosphate pyrophosphokinase